MRQVLVIDDSEATRDLIRDLLGSAGYEVRTAPDGAAALARAAEATPDLILCDILMPGLDGYDVLKALRREPSTAVTPVIFLTGMGGSEALRAGMNLGADDYLVKPVPPTELLAAVSARLERSEAVKGEADRRLQELKEELARSFLPHEFLTPLTAVMGLASLLMEEGAIEARDTKEVGRGILEAARRLEELIERFLAYAELHTSPSIGGPGLPGPEALQAAREEAEQRARRINRSEDLEVSGVPAPVPMASEHWRLLVREVVDNALRFSPRGSKVALQLATSDGVPRLSVRDQGEGMSPEHLEALERRAPFLRRHPEEAGLGLGLSCVRRLLQLYGGALSLDTAPGRGTTAEIRFPPPPVASNPA